MLLNATAVLALCFFIYSYISYALFVLFIFVFGQFVVRRGNNFVTATFLSFPQLCYIYTDTTNHAH